MLLLLLSFSWLLLLWFSGLLLGGFMSSSAAAARQQEARMEREVSVAARNFGDGVQRIVLAAKAKQGNAAAATAGSGDPSSSPKNTRTTTSNWKTELLALLGAPVPGDEPADSTSNDQPLTTADTPSKSSSGSGRTSKSSPPKSDIDILLANSKCEQFVLRCVENELPPNLIHCMRLLRVLELQHASQVLAASASSGAAAPPSLEPVGAKATAKVSRLLCALCVDPSVGEQLRPHLFGLLALSGACYPPSGVHVAKAASEIIIAFAEHCLTRQLVWFIHDRKMVLHMTDDVKELCGMAAAPSSAPTVPLGLSAAEAEQAGLWNVALETVIKLIAFSCRFHTVDLLKDFEAAGGYDVVEYAIHHSTTPYGSKIVELLPTLACCPNEILPDHGSLSLSSSSSSAPADKIASNVCVFEIQEELLAKANPILREYYRPNTKSENWPNLTPARLADLAAKSVEIGVQLRTTGITKNGDSAKSSASTTFRYDINFALLSATLQLFSDHPDNYDILEGRQHILSFYLLAFPCFDDDDLKNFILKTLEFVLTGVGVQDEVTPVHACVEIFFALCQALMKGADFLKVENDHKEEAMNLLAKDLDLMGNTLEKLLQFDQRVAPLMVESGILTSNLNSLLNLVRDFAQTFDGPSPPEETSLDRTFSMVCNVVKLLVAHQPVNFSKDSDTISPGGEESTNLHTLLRLAVQNLGDEAARSASMVFEAYMSSFASLIGLERDMKFTLNLLKGFGEDVAKGATCAQVAVIIGRQRILVSILRAVLEARSLARDAFRTCSGFDALVALFLPFTDATNDEMFPVDVLIKLVQAIVGLVEAAAGVKSRNPVATHDASPLFLSADVVVDPSSLQFSSGSPAATNRKLIRQRAFYHDLAVAIAGTGLLRKYDTAIQVVELCLMHIDSALQTVETTENINNLQSLRNPDGLRLLLGLCAFLPDTEGGNSVANAAFDLILRLSDGDKAGSTLRDLASCGLCSSLTDPAEFGPILFDKDHPLRLKFRLLLIQLASFSMSYMDFVGTIRCLTGPLLVPSGSHGRVRLPVISSSVAKSSMAAVYDVQLDGNKEEEFCERMELVCEIARNRDRYPRIKVGGDSINTIAVLMHKVKLEDRLRTAAEEGRLRFLEVESIDASAISSSEGAASSERSVASNTQAAEKIWTPLSSSGFSYSLWLRHATETDSSSTGNLYILDISSPSTLSSSSVSQGSAFLSVWYDIRNQRFNVMSSASHKGEPICFPVSPLIPNVWHHILMTYNPSKRTMMSRKSAFCLYVNGRALEAEIRVESVNLPPNSRVIVGAPNPALAASGIVRGMLPVWELGPSIMLSTVLLDLDATAIFAHGPDFPGMLWGDRPQRTSLAAAGTVVFSMLSESGETGSIASALKRRDVQKLEAAGYSVIGHAESGKDNLASLGLLCNIPPDCVIFAFQVPVAASRLRNEAFRRSRNLQSERLVNLGRLNLSNENVSTDAIVYGKSCVIAPVSFADCLCWIGGPEILMPLVNATNTARALALTFAVMREGTRRHPPNLEMMQAGGGYRVLAVLLKEKGFADTNCLDECLAFAVSGFELPQTNLGANQFNATDESSWGWVIADVDAMKNLLLNHQVWDLQKCGPAIPLRLLSALNSLVSQRAIHKSFNARRLHLVGIVRWALHLMLEGAELYNAGDRAVRQHLSDNGDGMPNVAWYSESPLVSEISVGGDPGNPFLLECKTLLRRVLTFMLTPGDLEALADAIVYTVSISAADSKSGVPNPSRKEELGRPTNEDRLFPGATARLYLVRLLEELIVDGVNEIVATVPTLPKRKESSDSVRKDQSVQVPYHAGGVASPNQPYLSSTSNRGKMADGSFHPKHQQAQAFLSAFAGYLTPVWFATVLEGCREEASASAVLRLLILMLQGSSSFEIAFKEAGGFSPFVLSVPKFSTCPGITLTMLSQLLSVPILHLHSFPTLDIEQLYEVFDAECTEFDASSLASFEPSSGIFALLAECLGRNIKWMSAGDEQAQKAKETNEAVIQLISHRHELSPAFQAFCSSAAFIEPLTQALCLVYNERLSISFRVRRKSRLSDVPKSLTATERFVGGSEEANKGGIGMVRLLRMVIRHAMLTGPRAAVIVNSVFRSFPVHASAQQVEAFHLVLLEQCKTVVEELLEKGEALAVANCIGLCSVLLDQEISAFFGAEACVNSVQISLLVLKSLTIEETKASRGLANNEHATLTLDAAHLAKLSCVVALKMSLPMNDRDPGDEDLQAAILELVDESINALLLVPRQDNSKMRLPSSSTIARPATNSKLFPLWQSSSLARCHSQKAALYPDLCESENPEIAVLAPLVVSLYRLLLGLREDVRSLSVSVLVALLQHRQTVMTELLVAEVQVGDHKETIDVVNRGGFRALVTAHEASTLSDSTIKKKYAAFFDWMDRNIIQVQKVFDVVDETGNRLFPGLKRVNLPQDRAIETEQKLMLMKLTAEASESTILGGIERGELARRCSERTTDSHSRWKRQGFDDLAFGAMKWKVLLRQLKGSSSVWEGGPRYDNSVPLRLERRLTLLKDRGGKTRDSGAGDGSFESKQSFGRWKLDLTEGSERQRRRLLPNYEFHGVYNLDEDLDRRDTGAQGDGESAVVAARDDGTTLNADFLVAPEMEATAALLKDLNLKRSSKAADETEFDDTDAEDVYTVATTGTSSTTNEGNSTRSHEESDASPVKQKEGQGMSKDKMVEIAEESEDSSSYGLITGLLQAGDWPEKSYNVRRCTGLEVTKALLLWCQEAIYIIDGFEQTGGAGMDGKITRVERERSSYYISLRPKDFKLSEEKTEAEMLAQLEEKGGAGHRPNSKLTKSKAASSSASDVIYQHRSQRISFSEVYSVFRRRYQLQQNALEFYDVDRRGTLIAFSNNEEREEVLAKVLQAKLPNSIFSSTYGTFASYSKFMMSLKTKIVAQWVNGRMTNFEFLMHLNSFAGRSFNDLTQYPVFPWIIADYESDELDLNDPKTFRDLSKPMGAIGEARAQQFRERYEALASTCFTEDDPPPFHYGTHYSSAAYVLYYLMRLEPFSRLALALQGGRFDVADRLFHDVGRSWRSASAENLQDVRELIPEFFYLGDFLVNTNHFDFGETQRGKTVHDVSLPKWARGDPQRFVRINRQALESEYVSRNLHHWLDLVFGFKQRGEAAVESLNVFVHVTYEGEVDLDSMTDPVQRASTIAQIQNFGQTPSRLERKPFPQRLVVSPLRERMIDFSTLPSLVSLTPPFCIVGAPHRVYVRPVSTESCKMALSGQADTAIGDMCLSKGQLFGVRRMCATIAAKKYLRYIRYGGVNNGVSVHSLTTLSRPRDKAISFHDAMHRAPITAARVSVDGEWLVTGCADSTIRVWRYDGSTFQLCATLCGHDGFQIKCIDISIEFGMIVSGCAEGKIILWDLRSFTFVRSLRPLSGASEPTVSLSINHKTGNIAALVGSSLSVFDVNGVLMASRDPDRSNPATCAALTDCFDWTELGIVAVTGHLSGEVRFWSMNYGTKDLFLRLVLPENPHTSAITALRVTGPERFDPLSTALRISAPERQDTLLVGDASGKMSICKTISLDSLSAEELGKVVAELERLSK